MNARVIDLTKSYGEKFHAISLGAMFEQHWYSINDRIAAAAAKTADDVPVQIQVLMADRTDEPTQAICGQGLNAHALS